MFSLNEYIQDLIVHQDDEELAKSLEVVDLTALICDDAWLSRQAYYGMAGAMERQLEYLGTTLLPNSEQKLTRMSANGVIGESYTPDSWFGTSNEDDPHVNEEISFDQQIEDQQNFIDQLRTRMRTAAILFVTHVRAHDELSGQLNQLSYSGIKAKAAQNRQVATQRRAVAA